MVEILEVDKRAKPPVISFLPNARKGFNADTREDYASHLLVLDGEIIPEDDCQVRFNPETERRGYLKVSSEDVADRLALHSFSGVAKFSDRLVLGFGTEDDGIGYLELVASISTAKRARLSNPWLKKPGYRVEFFFRTYANEWRGPATIADFAEKARELRTAEEYAQLEWEDDEDDPPPVLLHCWTPSSSSRTPIRDVLAKWMPLLYQLKDHVVAALDGAPVEHRLVARFDFPSEYRTAAEQYLLYFVEFLRDLGVPSIADVQHDGPTAIFSVTPASSREALTAIAAALLVYLDIPNHPAVTTSIVKFDDPMLHRLVANAQHLNGQLSLANAALQLKDATIGQLQATITFYQDRSRSVMQKSLMGVQPTPGDDSEPVIGDVVSVTKYQGKGFQIDLPEIVRRVRKHFLKKSD
jgi:hypothetical protein